MDKRFILAPSERCPITVLEDVKLVRLPMDGQVALKSVKKRTRLPAGGLIAIHNHPERGDLHAPFDCVVKEVSSAYGEMEYDPLPPPASKDETGDGGEKRARTRLHLLSSPKISTVSTRPSYVPHSKASGYPQDCLPGLVTSS